MSVRRKQTRSQSKLPGAEPLHPGLGRSKIVLRNRTRSAADAVVSPPQIRVELGTPVSTPSTGAYEEISEEDDPEAESSESSASMFPDFLFMSDYFLAEPSELSTNMTMVAPETQSDGVFQLAMPDVDFSSPGFFAHQTQPLDSPTGGVKRKEPDFLSNADESGAGSSTYASSNLSLDSLRNQPGSPLPKRVRELRASLDPGVDQVEIGPYGVICFGYPLCEHWPNLDTCFTHHSAGSVYFAADYYGQHSDSDWGYFPRGHLSDET